jgi:hypothetical protein
LHVATTLAHADTLIDAVGRMVADYTRAGAFTLEDEHVDGSIQLRVAAIKPLPAGIARTAADALTQLRAAIEHTVFAEVEFQLRRGVTPREARSIEMPAAAAPDEFTGWLSHGVRSQLPPLSAHLVQRIRDLQPFHRREPNEHPLKVLAEHTNHAKHRSPAVASTRLGAVVVHRPGQAPRREPSPQGSLQPLRPGDVLAEVPVGTQVPVDLWPAVTVRRPHTASWHVLGHELGDIEDWVRRIAVPHLITGHHNVTPLPPQLDTTIGHDDWRAALIAAGQIPAQKRIETRMQAEQLRGDLAGILATSPKPPDPRQVRSWIESLDDEEVIGHFDEIARWSAKPDMPRLQAAVDTVLEAIERHQQPGS